MTNKKKEYVLNYKFTPVDITYEGSGLKPLEILILSKMDSYIEKGQEVYLTDEQFASFYGVTARTVSNTMNNLEEKGYIKRNTEVCKGNGHVSKKRTLERGAAWYQNIQPNRQLTR